MYCMCVCMYVCMYVRVNFCGGSDTGDAATNSLYRDRQPASTSQLFSSKCTRPVPKCTRPVQKCTKPVPKCIRPVPKCTRPVPSQTAHNPWFYEIWNTSTLLKAEFAIGPYLDPDKSIQHTNYFLILRWRALSANIYIYVCVRACVCARVCICVCHQVIFIYEWFHTSNAQRMTAALRCALLGYHTARAGTFVQTFRDNLSVPTLGFKNPEDGTDRLYRNVGKKLALLAAWWPRKRICLPFRLRHWILLCIV